MPRWPLILRVRPVVLLVVVGVLLAAAWATFLAVDIVGVLDPAPTRPAWTLLFNDHPVEWSQWVLLAFAVATSGYLAGRLDALDEGRAARFFLLLAIGLGLMLLEEAGDIRHRVSLEVQIQFGSEIFGLPHPVVSDVPFFAALAAIPVYAVLRYGRHVWRKGWTGFYLGLAVLFYATVAIGSGLRHLSDFYIRMGARIDAALFGGRFPVPEGMGQERAHFMVMDSVIEESLELIAATLMLATVLAFARYLRQHDVARPDPTPDPEPAPTAPGAGSPDPPPTAV